MEEKWAIPECFLKNKAESWTIQRPSEIFNADHTELCAMWSSPQSHSDKCYFIILPPSHPSSKLFSFFHYPEHLNLLVRIQKRWQLKDISNKKFFFLQTCLSCLLNFLFSFVVPCNSSLGDFRQFIFLPCAEALENFPLLAT